VGGWGGWGGWKARGCTAQVGIPFIVWLLIRVGRARRMMMWRYIFDILAPLDRNKPKKKPKKKIEKERKDEE
jgi:hypothetical protein